MDQRLFDAARTGDVVALHALLYEDPLILDRICLTEFAETPLHVAALAGKNEFAKEIIRLMPSFAMELNKDGFAPMHLASARGHVEMVMELLKLDTDCSLCLQRDKRGRIPLHYAVVNGRIRIIEKLISHCSESLQEVTAVGETVLHLAVKNSQFGALQRLLERLKGLECFETLLSTKDNEGKGKTIVELAEATKQVQVLKALKEYQNVHTDNDASAISPGPGNHEIKVLAADKEADQHQIGISSDTETDDKHESKEEEDKEPSKLVTRELVLVIAGLIATVTYQAVVTPPSTIWKEGVKLNARCIFKKSTNKIVDLQKFKRDCPAFMYYSFMLSNSAGFFSSAFLMLHVTVMYVNRMPSLLLLVISMIFLIANYEWLIFGLAPDNTSAVVVSVVPEVIVLLLHWIILFMINRKKKIRETMARNNPKPMQKFLQTILKCKK